MKTKKTKFRSLVTGKIVTMWQTTEHHMVNYGMPVWVDKDNYCYGQCSFWPVPFGFEPVLEQSGKK
jgi:hypothetical protein